MSQQNGSIIDCVKEFLSENDDDLISIILPLNKIGHVTISYGQFKELVRGISVDIDYRDNFQNLLKIFGDNVHFIMKDKYLHHIRAVPDSDKDFDYTSFMIYLKDDDADDRWNSFSVGEKRDILFNFFDGNLRRIHQDT
jgi:hypothetical protein